MELTPMLATLADAPLVQKGLVYEPKYDGIRAIVEAGPRTPARIWSRNGNEKTAQFPAVVHALEALAAGLKGPVVLDGEIVALDESGRPAGFQRLQGRMHLLGARDIERAERAQPVALVVFDILRDGKDDLCKRPLLARRERLEKLLAATTRGRSAKTAPGVIRISEQVAGDATALHARALEEGWEGLIAKDASSTYQPGRRSPAWRKIKLLKEQEFVVGGWTEPRQTRQYFGALLLGVQEAGRLKYVGHTGTGFDQKELARLWKLLKAREQSASPFSNPIKTNEPAHWVRPDLVAQIRFTEWTADDKLRHPVYLGLRDDKRAEEVVREGAKGADGAKGAKGAGAKGAKGAKGAGNEKRAGSAKGAESTKGAESAKRAEAKRRPPRGRESKDAGGAAKKQRTVSTLSTSTISTNSTLSTSTVGTPGTISTLGTLPLLDALRELEDARKDGELTLPNGDRLKVTNLSKLFWPALEITKGDLLRYYVEVSPYLLPAVEDRPLVMKRFPNGVGGKAFYQQRSREERPPAGVRIETLEDAADPISEPDARRLIGGSLTTLLYMTQIAAISQDPWFSRVQSPHEPDHVAIDLDPTDTATFAQVLDVARWVRDELQALGIRGFPKTSGSSGLHVYIPLPPGTSYESGLLLCQIVATLVATRHPKHATVERTVARRPRATVYVDYLQNILGKTLATAYSARASDYAGVSTPVTWKDVDGALDPREFTVRTAPARFRKVGDLWQGLRTTSPADLNAVLEKFSRRAT